MSAAETHTFARYSAAANIISFLNENYGIQLVPLPWMYLELDHPLQESQSQ